MMQQKEPPSAEEKNFHINLLHNQNILEGKNITSQNIKPIINLIISNFLAAKILDVN